MIAVLLKSLSGVVFLLLELALALFLPAWSLGFRQAWLFLAVFGAGAVLVNMYLLRYGRTLLINRARAGVVAESRTTKQLIEALAGFLFLGMLIVSGLDYRWHWSTVPLKVSVFANGFVALGFLLVIMALKASRCASAVGVAEREQMLVTGGVYGLVRHPLYAGTVILLLASPLALGSLVAFPFPLLLTLLIVVLIRKEEKVLTAKVEGYRAYCRKVRFRLLPHVW